MVAERGFVTVFDASNELDVSAVTVRSDLRTLENAGILRRVRGGAIPVGKAEPSFEVSTASSASEKAKIARVAASMVSSGMSVLLDVGSTTAAVAKALVSRTDLHDVTIITNSLAIALDAEPAIGRFTVVVTGGTLRPLQHSLVAPLSSVLLERIRADIAFIGCNGVEAASGVTNVNLLEAEMKRAMISSATRSVVVADSSKIGAVHLAHVGDLTEFDALVTGPAASRSAIEQLRAVADIEIYCAGGLDHDLA